MNSLRVSLAGLVMGMTAVAASDSPVTFNKDVLPILQKNCQGCHRPGEMAPMSFLTYQRYAALGQGDETGGADQEDAAVVRGERPLCQ